MVLGDDMRRGIDPTYLIDFMLSKPQSAVWAARDLATKTISERDRVLGDGMCSWVDPTYLIGTTLSEPEGAVRATRDAPGFTVRGGMV